MGSTDFSVVMVMYNHTAMTQRALASIWLGGCGPREIVLVDNASTEAAPGGDFFITVRMAENYSLARAINAGVAQTTAPNIVLLNNDLLVHQSGLTRLVEALERDETLGIVGQEGAKLDSDLRYCGADDVNPDYIEFFCCAIPRSVWETVGPLDEEMKPVYAEDSDWCIRARQAGYRLGVVKNCCTHFGGGSSQGNPALAEASERNRLRLIEKHGRNPLPRVPLASSRPDGKGQFQPRRVVWPLTSPGLSGGIKVARQMMMAMREAGWEVTVCSRRPQHEWGWADWSFARILSYEQLEPPYDLVVATHHESLPEGAQIQARRRLALIQADEPEWDRDPQAAANFRTPGYQHVIIAEHMRAYAEKYGMSIVGLVENGVDSTVFYPDGQWARAWPHRIMFVRKSGPHEYVGENVVAAAVGQLAQRYPDLEAIVVGHSTPPQWPCMVRHVQTSDENEMRRQYNQATCLVRASFVEGFPLIDLEAMACGLPLVVTPIGIDDAAVDGESALFVPIGDSEAIVEAVSRVFDDAALREKLSRNGLRLARERTWAREQEQWTEIVDRVMGEVAGGQPERR